MRYSADLSCEFETKGEGDTATFKGIASTSDADSHNDIIHPGAFEPIAINERTGGPDVMMLRDHDRTQVIGGWNSFSQQGHRLIVEGAFCLEVEKARETYALLKRGYLSGLSVGFWATKDNVSFSERTGRRYIKKATLTECSIVAVPANRNARVTSVKCDDIAEWLAERGMKPEDISFLESNSFDALIADRLKDAEKPYGDVRYADPGYQEDGKKRYPIDTEGHIRAAWNYINRPDNQKPYSREEVDRIKRRIIAAWRDKIDSDGPPGADEKSGGSLRITGIDEELSAADMLREMVAQLRGCTP